MLCNRWATFTFFIKRFIHKRKAVPFFSASRGCSGRVNAGAVGVVSAAGRRIVQRSADDVGVLARRGWSCSRRDVQDAAAAAAAAADAEHDLADSSHRRADCQPPTDYIAYYSDRYARPTAYAEPSPSARNMTLPAFTAERRCIRHGTGSLGHRVNRSFGSSFTSGSPGHHFDPV